MFSSGYILRLYSAFGNSQLSDEMKTSATIEKDQVRDYPNRKIRPDNELYNGKPLWEYNRLVYGKLARKIEVFSEYKGFHKDGRE